MPKKENIQDMFDSIAPEYDKLNHIMSLDIDKTWRKRALNQIFRPNGSERAMAAAGDSENGGLHVLDIACGTGDFSIAIAKEMLRRAAGNRDAAQSQEDTDAGDFLRTGGYWPGKVIGVDLSEGMLKIMGEKVKAAGLEKMISYETGDCENLRFEDGTFDRVTVAFGVRNFENREKGLKEMLRVLRPGGELVILELSVPSNAVMRWLYKLYFLHILPVITSCVQARVMQQMQGKGPVKIICPGKVYRRDNDATHSHQFGQIEGLVISEDCTFSNLLETLTLLLKHLFGEKREIRFRPSFFPFTEPSVEADISCFECNGKGCNFCKHTGWIEVLGSGMVHPNVLRLNGYDDKKYKGFAFGIGVDRIAMLKYNIDDIKRFYTNDVNFISQFRKE